MSGVSLGLGGGGGSATPTKYAKLSDTKSPSSSGGSFTSGSFQTRDLNTKDVDADSIVTLSANQFTLEAGTYRIRAKAPGRSVDGHQAKIRNITDSSDEIIGTSAYSSSGVTTHSFIDGEITITGTKTFELQHKCETTAGSTGFGFRSDSGENEIYSTVEIEKK